MSRERASVWDHRHQQGRSGVRLACAILVGVALVGWPAAASGGTAPGTPNSGPDRAMLAQAPVTVDDAPAAQVPGEWLRQARSATGAAPEAECGSSLMAGRPASTMRLGRMPAADTTGGRLRPTAGAPGHATGSDCATPEVSGPRGGFMPAPTARRLADRLPTRGRQTPTTPRISATAATYSISGTVTGPGGVPLADIYVQAESDADWNEAFTNLDGTFSIPVTAGTYYVSFTDWSEAYTSGWYSTGGFVLDRADATPVVVTTAGRTGINAELTANHFISGTITGAGAVGLAEIVVVVYSDAYVVESGTFDDGSYSAGVPSGEYVVAVYDPESVYASGYWSTGGFTPDSASATPVVVTTADVPGIDLTLPKNPRILGTVRSPGGTAIANVEVTAESTGEGGAYESVSTAADGTYVLPVPPDSYRVSFRDPTTTYASGYWSAAGYTADEDSATPVTVVAADVPGIDVTLPRALHIKGKVTGPGGIPATGVNIWAEGGNSGGDGKSSSTGAYSIAVAPGIYRLAVSDSRSTATYADGYYRSGGFTLDAGAASAVVVTTADVTVNFSLPKMVQVKGKVTGPTGSGLPGIRVMSSAGTGADTKLDGTYSLPVPANGSWSLQFFDEAGTYTSGFYRSAGFTRDRNLATPVAVATATVSGINVKLPKNLRIKGTVTQPGGGVIPNIGVYASSIAYGASAETAPDGTFSIGVPAGSYTVAFEDGSNVFAGGYYGTSGYSQDTPKTMTLTTADVSLAGVELPPLTLVSGVITDAGSTPLEGIEVDAWGDRQQGSDTVWTEADGSYKIAVAPGTYIITFADPSDEHAGGYLAASGLTLDRHQATRLVVTGASVTGIDAHLDPMLHLQGTVAGPGGAAVRHAMVYAFSTAWETWASVGADGSYSVAVPPGDYGVQFTDLDSSVSGYFGGGEMTATPVEAMAVSLTTTDVAGIDAEFPVTHAIGGRITGAGVSGLPGVAVCAESASQVVCGETAPDGKYALGVPSGSYVIAVMAGAASSYMSSWAGMWSGGYYATTGFKALAGQASRVVVDTADVAGINVALPRNLLITGRVTAPNGVGVANVSVYQQGTEGWRYGSTAPDGRYTLGVPAGSYRIMFDSWYAFSYPYGWYGSSGFTTSAPKSVTVTTANVSGISIKFPKPVWITGRVTGPGGRAMVGIGVLAETSSGYGLGLATDDSGSFALVVAAGTYKVGYQDDWGGSLGLRSPSGYYASGGFTLSAAAATKIVVGTSNVSSVNTQVPAGRRISGHVTSPNKLPLGSVAVTASDGSYSSSGYTDSAGSYGVAVPDGTFTMLYDDLAGMHAKGWYGGAGYVGDVASSTGVTASGADATDIDVVLPLDTDAPTTSAPGLALRKGASVSSTSTPVTISWTGSDGPVGGGVARYELARSTDGGATWPVVSSTLTATSLATTAPVSGTVQYRVRAVDHAGNVGDWQLGPVLAPRLVQQNSSAVKYGGTWTSSTSSSYSGGTVRYASTSGRTASYKFTGRSIALVTTRAKTRGSVKVYLDGVLAATVSTYYSSTTYRYQIWQKTWPSSGTHTIKLVVSGTSGHPRVDLDAFSVVP